MSKVKFIHIVKDNFSKNKTIKISGNKVEIKTYVDAETYATVVKTIADNCFKDNQYYPEYFEIVRRYVILNYFTNIDLTNVSLEEIFKASQKGNWFCKIEKEVITLPIWKSIEVSASNCIEYAIKSRKTSFDNLCDSFNTTVTTMNSSIDIGVIKELNDRLKKASDKEIIDKISSNRTSN